MAGEPCPLVPASGQSLGRGEWGWRSGAEDNRNIEESVVSVRQREGGGGREREREGETDRQTDRYTERQTDRLTDR